MKKMSWALVSLFVLAIVATVVFAYTNEQAAQGEKIYTENCAACHGAKAQGGVVPQKFGALAGKKVPPLAGPNAMPGMENAAQVYEFARTNMLANNPGSLKNEQYLDVVSFALKANGVAPDNQPLTPESAKKIKLPGR